jgi:hypothetical protein
MTPSIVIYWVPSQYGGSIAISVSVTLAGSLVAQVDLELPLKDSLC